MNLTDIIEGKIQTSKAEEESNTVYLYLRASDPQQESRGLTVPAQREESRAYAEANGITIVGEFVEVQSSFQEKSRPIFMEMVDKVLFDTLITGVLVHEHSRFFRHPYEGPHFKNLFRKPNASVPRRGRWPPGPGLPRNSVLRRISLQLRLLLYLQLIQFLPFRLS